MFLDNVTKGSLCDAWESCLRCSLGKDRFQQVKVLFDYLLHTCVLWFFFYKVVELPVHKVVCKALFTRSVIIGAPLGKHWQWFLEDLDCLLNLSIDELGRDVFLPEVHEGFVELNCFMRIARLDNEHLTAALGEKRCDVDFFIWHASNDLTVYEEGLFVS